jgi:nucleotide-binding universal stress UspA family protein
MTPVTELPVSGRPEMPRAIPDRILVGVDFRQPSLAAAKWAAAHFGACAGIELAHVLPVPEVPRFLQPIVPLDNQLINGPDSQLPALRGFAETLGDAGLSVHVRVGQPADRLAELAGSLGAGLVVAGRTAVGRNRGVTLQRLVRRVAVPALILDGRPAVSPRRILAAVDDAEIGSGVVDWAARLARHFGAELMLLHVRNDGLIGEERARERASEQSPCTMLGRSCRWVAPTHKWLQSLQRNSGSPSDGRTIVAVGTAGPVILERARTSKADMIVVGRNGAHALSSTDMGSATRLILRGTQVPVLVVPTPAKVGVPTGVDVESLGHGGAYSAESQQEPNFSGGR